MRLRLTVFGCVILLSGAVARAQLLNNASLTGKYYFVQLLVEVPVGQAATARNAGGAITFDGSGSYTYSGKLGMGSGALAAVSGQGTYSVEPSGAVTLSSPIRGGANLTAWLSADRLVLLGAGTEAPDNANDIFMAIRAPQAAASNALLAGAYSGASLAFPNGDVSGVRSALLLLAAGGAGRFTRVVVSGHAADQVGRNVAQEVSAASYSIGADGTGSASFGTAADLFSGDRELFVSSDGNYVLGYSTAGARDILVAVKGFAAPVPATALDGLYRIAELTFDGRSFSAASGALMALPKGRALFAERLHLEDLATDYSGINSYTVNSEGTGALAPPPISGLKNMAVGVAAAAGRAEALVGAQVGPLDASTDQYGVFFAVRAPALAATGVFLDPTGVANGASFAPLPHPVCPGAIVSLFGAALGRDTLSAGALPLPSALGGVSVTVEALAAPLFYVSPGQVNVQVPFGLRRAGDPKVRAVTIQLNTAGGQSNAVKVPLAATCPGIFSYDDGRSPDRGVILHADFTLVTPEKPARPGETVILYVTGLGELTPAVPGGAAAPASPPARALDSPLLVFFGGEPASGLLFAGGAPGFAGLYQVNVVVPAAVPVGPNVPVAIFTGNAFTDLVDIPISR